MAGGPAHCSTAASAGVPSSPPLSRTELPLPLPACSCCLAGYSAVQGPSTCMVRPHPAVWRLVHGIMVCYLMFMVYLLFQTVDDARQFLRVGGMLLEARQC